jgi:hypothetical protein
VKVKDVERAENQQFKQNEEHVHDGNQRDHGRQEQLSAVRLTVDATFDFDCESEADDSRENIEDQEERMHDSLT